MAETCELCGRKAELVTFIKEVSDLDGHITSYKGDICEKCKDREQARFNKETGLDLEPF